MYDRKENKERREKTYINHYGTTCMYERKENKERREKSQINHYGTTIKRIEQIMKGAILLVHIAFIVNNPWVIETSASPLSILLCKESSFFFI
jgi:hypothetical protein